MQNLNSIPIVGKFTDAASAANNNFAAVKLAIDQLELTTSRAKGLFTSVSALSAKHPSPVVGDWAIVQDNEVSPPVAIVYKCSTSGTWSNTGMEWEGGSVDLSEYALIADVPECGYYTCNTGASTAAKTVSASGFHLNLGGNVRILMANANTAANPTLNIGSTGAKPLYYDGEPASSTNSWVAGETVMVYYDGTRFMASNSQSSGGKFRTGEKVRDMGVSDVPTENSDDLMTSGGVYDACYIGYSRQNIIYQDYKVLIDGVELGQNAKYINSSNEWAQQRKTVGGVTYHAMSVNIPVTGGGTIYLTCNSSFGAIYAFLKSNTPVGTTADFCSGYSGRVVLNASQEVELTIPSDCTLFYLFVHTYAVEPDNFFPSTLVIRNDNSAVPVSTAIIQTNTEVASISREVNSVKNEIYGGGDKVLNFSSYPIYQNFINSSDTWNSDLTRYPIGSYVHILIPVVAGAKFKIKTTDHVCIYAFLTGDEYLGTPSFVSGYTQRYSINQNTESEITIPSGCVYLYIYKGTPTDNFLSTITITQLNNTDGLIDEKQQFRSIYNRGVMMGDSISAGVCSYLNNGSRYNDFYTYEQVSDYIGKLLGIPFDNVAKRGTGYVADTRNINNAWEQALATNYANYDVVVMMYGVNDYIQHVELGDPEIEAVDTVAGNMQRVFNKIMTDNPNCKILCVGSYNCWGQVSVGGDYTSNVEYGDATTDYALGYQISGHTLRDYLDLQKTMCEKYHVQFYCLADASVVNSMNIKYALADGLHPTIEMRKYIAQEIAKQLM